MRKQRQQRGEGENGYSHSHLEEIDGVDGVKGRGALNGVEKLISPLSNADKRLLLPSFLQLKGLVRQHIDSFNHFVEVDIHKIISANREIVSDNQSFRLTYTGVRIGSPQIRQDSFHLEKATPMECRLRNVSYASQLIVDVKYTLNGKGAGVHEARNVCIGNIPIMLRSNKCALYNATAHEAAKLGECPIDPGGYFIVNGTEKVVLMQEQLSNNRIIVEQGKKGGLMASVTSSSLERKTKTIITYNKSMFTLKVNTLNEEVPLMVIIKAMGITSDQEFMQMVGSDHESMETLGPSIQHCADLGIFTQQQALRYLGTKVRIRRDYGAYQSKEDDARMVLATVIVCHIEVKNHNLRPKVLYLAVMVRHIIKSLTIKKQGDDRDYYGNKRIELAGSLVALLFEDCFKTFNGMIKREADRTLNKVTATAFDPIRCMTPDVITNSMKNAISTGNWKLKRFRMDQAGVTSVLSRLSFISALGMMTRISSQFEKTRKVSGPRSLQPSQWGMLCPSDTPEGETCGLVKNLALMSYVTMHVDDEALVELAYDLGVESLHSINGSEFTKLNIYTVFVNGKLLGITHQPNRLVTAIRKLRRGGRVNEFVSTHIGRTHRCVHISSDSGRVCRPYLIVTNGKMVATPSHFHDLSLGVLNFDDFIRLGLIEYLDVNEENDSLIALYDSDISSKTTHVEIEPFSILGVCAGLIPYPHHNQSPRITYQCAMGKQAMGVIAYNYQKRIDTLLYALVYPQRPLVKTKTIELIDFEKLPAGQNAIIAVMSYSGYDIEDAIIINRAALDRGYGRCMVYRKNVTALKKGGLTTDKILPAPVDEHGKPKPKFDKLDNDGIIQPGLILDDKDVLVNKHASSGRNPATNEPIFSPEVLRYHGTEGKDAVVDQVMVSSSSEDQMIVKVKVRSTRVPELGDKFSSRHGQKGVCGLIVNAEDMPFSEGGVVPDMIMNPHGFPSRMTVGKLMELVGGKAGLMSGNFNYGTAFGGTPLSEICTTLVDHGYNYHGKDYVTSGTSGEPLEAFIFFGPVYYQKLKHMVMDKMHARSTGPMTLLTRQPTEGRSKKGGLRLGEMERDCLIGHGSSMLLLERLMLSSDSYKMNACSKCGLLGYSGWCQYCKSSRHVSMLQLPYACKLLFQELQSMNIVPRLTLDHYSKC
eukprot:m.81120 g.81120  ORF g.81120 m.81120 type:complete len:1154 (+) comp12046_c0_seq2:38-3499(+)